ncbi:MAG: IclR family transcriptional regulator [Nonomuraea sp.]|nr:IclR family transcriptional regulator [Nonomuraea sp.]
MDTTQRLPSSLEKGIMLLSALGQTGRPAGLVELTGMTGLPKSTTHRLLAVLCTRGLARRVGTGYVLDGCERPRSPGSRRTVLPYLLRLWEATHATVNLAVPHGLETRYVERLYGQDRVRSRSDGVDRAPLYCTATGKVLLAFDHRLHDELRRGGQLYPLTPRTVTRRAVLEQELRLVGQQGVAYALEEFTEGLSCVAAPVFGADGRVCMAVGVAGRAASIPLSRLADTVSTAARAITAALSA